eukprot:augustus_masked-scaffold_53-processed-gene-0.1-mRNA-1 protein AED:1.00 eAED:1.00 QI:0/-1/0/0/-1/1/1/0/1256
MPISTINISLPTVRTLTGSELLSASLNDLQNIESLTICSSLRIQHLLIIRNILFTTHTLRSLSLPRCNLSKQGCTLLAHGLAYNTSLLSLSLKNNHVEATSVLSFYLALLVNPSSGLLILDLSHNPVDKDCKWRNRIEMHLARKRESLLVDGCAWNLINVCVIGAVGAGKTSLLSGLLGTKKESLKRTYLKRENQYPEYNIIVNENDIWKDLGEADLWKCSVFRDELRTSTMKKRRSQQRYSRRRRRISTERARRKISYERQWPPDEFEEKQTVIVYPQYTVKEYKAILNRYLPAENEFEDPPMAERKVSNNSAQRQPWSTEKRKVTLPQLNPRISVERVSVSRKRKSDRRRKNVLSHKAATLVGRVDRTNSRLSTRLQSVDSDLQSERTFNMFVKQRVGSSPHSQRTLSSPDFYQRSSISRTPSVFSQNLRLEMPPIETTDLIKGLDWSEEEISKCLPLSTLPGATLTELAEPGDVLLPAATPVFPSNQLNFHITKVSVGEMRARKFSTKPPPQLSETGLLGLKLAIPSKTILLYVFDASNLHSKINFMHSILVPLLSKHSVLLCANYATLAVKNRGPLSAKQIKQHNRILNDLLVKYFGQFIDKFVYNFDEQMVYFPIFTKPGIMRRKSSRSVVSSETSIDGNLSSGGVETPTFQSRFGRGFYNIKKALRKKAESILSTTYPIPSTWAKVYLQLSSKFLSRAKFEFIPISRLSLLGTTGNKVKENEIMHLLKHLRKIFPVVYNDLTHTTGEMEKVGEAVLCLKPQTILELMLRLKRGKFFSQALGQLLEQAHLGKDFENLKNYGIASSDLIQEFIRSAIRGLRLPMQSRASTDSAIELLPFTAFQSFSHSFCETEVEFPQIHAFFSQFLQENNVIVPVRSVSSSNSTLGVDGDEFLVPNYLPVVTNPRKEIAKYCAKAKRSHILRFSTTKSFVSTENTTSSAEKIDVKKFVGKFNVERGSVDLYHFGFLIASIFNSTNKQFIEKQKSKQVIDFSAIQTEEREEQESKNKDTLFTNMWKKFIEKPALVDSSDLSQASLGVSLLPLNGGSKPKRTIYQNYAHINKGTKEECVIALFPQARHDVVQIMMLYPDNVYRYLSVLRNALNFIHSKTGAHCSTSDSSILLQITACKLKTKLKKALAQGNLRQRRKTTSRFDTFEEKTKGGQTAVTVHENGKFLSYRASKELFKDISSLDEKVGIETFQEYASRMNKVAGKKLYDWQTVREHYWHIAPWMPQEEEKVQMKLELGIDDFMLDI